MSRIIRILVLAGLCCVGLCSKAQMTPMTDWEFSLDSVKWERVSVPHSYNAIDGRSSHYYRGKGYYRTEFSLTKLDLKGNIALYFEGAAQAATVYLNGKEVKRHKGGYTPFDINLSSLSKVGKNEIVVVCDNSVDLELAPIDSDFNKNGGLHNPVSLYRAPKTGFSLLFGKDRIHVSTPRVTKEEADIQITGIVEGLDKKGED